MFHVSRELSCWDVVETSAETVSLDYVLCLFIVVCWFWRWKQQMWHISGNQCSNEDLMMAVWSECRGFQAQIIDGTPKLQRQSHLTGLCCKKHE